jgi:hypothetical protein
VNSGTRFLATGAIAVLFLLSGCSDDSTPTTSDSEGLGALPSEPRPGVRQEVRGLSGGGAAVFNAEAEIVRRCMAARGLTYIKGPVATDTIEEPSFGITVEEARASGYGFNDQGVAHDEFIDPNDAVVAALSQQAKDDWAEALLGPPDGERTSVEVPGIDEISYPNEGCQADARADLYGSQQSALEATAVLDNLPIAALQRADQDPRMAELNDAWAQCMTQAGTSGLASPEDARAMVGGEIRENGFQVGRTTEMRIAVEDAECEEQSHYADARRRIEDIYLTQMLTAYESRIEEAAAIRRAAVGTAGELLGES